MLTVTTSETIDAPLDEVFDVIIGFERYPDWNPFVVRVDGGAALGARIELSVRFATGKRTTAREEIEVLSRSADRAELTYRYLGPLATFGMVRAVRKQVVTRTADGRTRYESVERFTGLLSPFVPRDGVKAGFVDTARALKRHAEHAHQARRDGARVAQAVEGRAGD